MIFEFEEQYRVCLRSVGWYNNTRSESQDLIRLISMANNMGRFVTIGVYSFRWVVRMYILFGIFFYRIWYLCIFLYFYFFNIAEIRIRIYFI
jgi:hypothetical protein